MNKTLSIGLAGFSFTIEEHAYIKLSDYLAALKSSLDANEADEVMHDIEIRMVEIFKDSLGKREVINDIDVEKVIAQIGRPEIIEEQEEAYFSEKTSTKKNQRTSGGFQGQKQLFRDPEKQKIAGVCAGLAHYVGMDIATMRIIWVAIAVLGIFSAHISTLLFVLIYIILWIVLPKAETATDFLKMKGKPMNFDNLKNESNKLVQFANESTQRVGEIYNENKPYINNAGSGLWNILRYLLGAIFAFMSLSCIIGTFFIFGMFGTQEFPGMNEFHFLFEESGMNHVLTAMMIIGTLIPALIFGLLSIKLFSPKTKLNNVGWVIGALVLMLIVFGSWFGFNMAKRDMLFKGHKEDTENVAINTTSDTLFVDKKQVAIPQNFIGYDDDIYSDKKTVFEGDYPDIDVTRRPDVKTPYLIIKKEGKGYNIPLQLEVPVEIQGNKILFPNFVKYPYQHRFRDYNVNYELVVPQKMKVLEYSNNKVRLDDDEIENDENSNDSTSVNSSKNSVVISSGSDSVIVNGKKVSEGEADLMMKKIDKKDLKDINITVKDGKKELIIKTK